MLSPRAPLTVVWDDLEITVVLKYLWLTVKEILDSFVSDYDCFDIGVGAVTFFCWRPYATGRLEDSGHQNDEKMSRETVHSRSCVTFFRYSAVLRLPADLFRKVVALKNSWILFWRLLFFSHARNTTAKTVLGSTRSCNVRLQFLRASPSHHRLTQFAIVGKSDTRPFYSCLLSCLAFKWKWVWRWPCFDKSPCFSFVNDAVFLLISRNLRKKISKLSLKTRSTPASFSFRGQATKQTTVKWSTVFSEPNLV